MTNSVASRESMTAADVMAVSPVIPVITIEDAGQAVPLARALVAGGVRVAEITLRTPAGLESVRRVAAEVPEIVVGAGTVLDLQQAEASLDAGSRFLVSPGTTPSFLRDLAALPVPVLPGVATVSEAMTAREQGFFDLKFFPAGVAGGPAALAAFGAPLQDLRFCPTGGVSLANAKEYLRLGNVACVGGSWLTPSAALREGDWETVTREAAAAAALRAA